MHVLIHLTKYGFDVFDGILYCSNSGNISACSYVRVALSYVRTDVRIESRGVGSLVQGGAASAYMFYLLQ